MRDDEGSLVRLTRYESEILSPDDFEVVGVPTRALVAYAVFFERVVPAEELVLGLSEVCAGFDKVDGFDCRG